MDPFLKISYVEGVSYEFYKIGHLVSLFALFLSYGMMAAGSSSKKWSAALHGTASLLLFISGFGLIAKLKIPLQMADSLLWPLVYAFLWFLPAALYLILSKRVRLPINPYFEKLNPLFLLFFIFMSLLELSKWLAPAWIGVKLSVWLILAMGPVALAGRGPVKKGAFSLVSISLFLLIISFIAVRAAIYKN